jgi:hypothetical protein
MERTLEIQGITTTRFIECNPDKLIELGHRIKAAAMDLCYPGESVTAKFSDEITLIYHPDKEFCKPLHKIGNLSGYGTSFYLDDENNGAYPV